MDPLEWFVSSIFGEFRERLTMRFGVDTTFAGIRLFSLVDLDSDDVILDRIENLLVGMTKPMVPYHVVFGLLACGVCLRRCKLIKVTYDTPDFVRSIVLIGNEDRPVAS